MTQSDKARVERIRHSAKECYPVSFTAKDVLFLLSLLDKTEKRAEAAIANLKNISRRSYDGSATQDWCDACLKTCKYHVDFCDNFEWKDPTKKGGKHMKKLARISLLILCMLVLRQYSTGAHVYCLPEPTTDFCAFQFPTLAYYWDKLGEWSHWEYIE